MDDKSIHFVVPCIENMDLLFDEASKQTNDYPYCGAGTTCFLYALRQKSSVSSLCRAIGNIIYLNMCIV